MTNYLSYIANIPSSKQSWRAGLVLKASLSFCLKGKKKKPPIDFI